VDDLKELGMKVVGTGSPETLTVRARPCEIRVLRMVTEERRTEATRAAVDLQSSAESWADSDRAEQLSSRHRELVAISRIFDQLTQPPTLDQPLVIAGPAALVAPLVREAARAAVQGLWLAVDNFCVGIRSPTADQLRAQLDAAHACTSTLLALDFVENHIVGSA
jgi:hypothetical protein